MYKEELLSKLSSLKHLQEFWKKEVDSEYKQMKKYNQDLDFVGYSLDTAHINYGSNQLTCVEMRRTDYELFQANHTAFSMLCTVRTQIKIIEKELKRLK